MSIHPGCIFMDGEGNEALSNCPADRSGRCGALAVYHADLAPWRCHGSALRAIILMMPIYYALIAIGYLAIAALSYAVIIGDLQFEYQYHWLYICPTADDYSVAVVLGLIPIAWPAVAAVACAHAIKEGRVPLALTIHRRIRG